MSAEEVFMPFPQPQLDATFLGRTQRFLAQVQFPNGFDELAYCANPGSMSGCLTPGNAALLWDSTDFKRKRRYTLRAIEFDGLWIGTDTHLSNRIVEEALKLKLIPGLNRYCDFVRERSIEEGFRVDFVLSGPEGDCLMEVKSSAVVENGVARYPDCLTPRGVRQLKALTRQVVLGKRAVLLFLVQRSDAHSFVVSSSFNPNYAAAFEEAVASGVEVMALSISVTRAGFGMPKLLPYAHSPMVSVDTNRGVRS
jgi:sugar fermentation stimulation protein A